MEIVNAKIVFKSQLIVLLEIYPLNSMFMAGIVCFHIYVHYLFQFLRSLDTEANKFYDRTNRLYDAALLRRCYTQHALRPVIDSETNHIRRFIKIPFINKDIDFIKGNFFLIASSTVYTLQNFN